MSRTSRNILLGTGIVLSILLLWVRVQGQVSNGLGMFSGVLGYEGQKNYALILLDPNKEPLLLVGSVSEGTFHILSITSAKVIIKNEEHTPFSDAAKVIVHRIIASKVTPDVDALGFMTIDAAGEVADAFGGLYIKDVQVTSKNIGSIVAQASQAASSTSELNATASFHKANLFTNGKALLYAAKNIFSKGAAAVYFKNESPVGKPCIGACNIPVFESGASGGSLKP